MVDWILEKVVCPLKEITYCNHARIGGFENDPVPMQHVTSITMY
jgi:hypothetical protein